MTCSTSPCVTSLSRIATTPCEFKLLTWLPAIPAYTEWISQPAMSSASSTARWIDCTVDSILTTTPFLRPREGCDPSPITSIAPSAPISPTSATTFEVPISRPTMRLRSERLGILASVLARAARAARLPANRKAVAVAHVDVGDLIRARRDEFHRSQHEALEALIDLAAAEAHRDAVRQIHFPRAALIKPQRRQMHACFDEPALCCEIARRDRALRAGWSRQARKLRWNVRRFACKELTARIQKPALAPARGCDLFDHRNRECARPGALHAHRIDPGDRGDGGANRIQIHRHQALAACFVFDGALDVSGRDALKAAGDQYSLNRLIKQQRDSRDGCHKAQHHCGGDAPATQIDGRQAQAALILLASVLGSLPDIHRPKSARAPCSSRAPARRAHRSRCRRRAPPWARGCDRSCPEWC